MARYSRRDAALMLAGLPLLLTGCGFRLRGRFDAPFATLYLQTRRLIDAYEKIWDLQAELNRLKRQNRHAPVCSGGINVHRYDPATSSGPENVDGIDRHAD